jgi:tetratricopeptide (TPR) repeat protein
MAEPFRLNEALHDAVMHQRQGELRKAERLYARVLKAAPHDFNALNLYGTLKAQTGHFGEAERLFQAAVRANPQAPQGWANLGQALFRLKRAPEALECLDRAIALDPSDSGILTQRGHILLALDRPQEALAIFEGEARTHPIANYFCGLALAALDQHEAALERFDRALAIAPGDPEILYNRGVALMKLGRYAEAAAACDQALAKRPDHRSAWLNRGRALAQLNRYQEAIASYDAILQRDKDNADAHLNRALARLTLGDYPGGFADYEWRWRRTGMPPQKPRGRPLWLGEYPLAHKTILLHAEQGLGDTIQFARYVPLLAAAGARVVLEVQAELKPLMASLGSVITLIARGETPPAFDVHCPLGSLPLATNTTPASVPAQIPYLKADPDAVAAWSLRLEALPRPRIALAWSGNPAHENDRNRSITFARLAPLLDLPAAFISVQRDVRPADAMALAAESRVTALGEALHDFRDAAAVLALADLVVTVDTAVLHLAGAMGRPAWLLVPFAPDWRWGLQGDATPWYPDIRLFRQTRPGDWDEVIARVGAALRGTFFS